MDVRGDGEVSWEDFSGYVLQLELLHDSKGAVDNEHYFQHFAAHIGMDGHISRVDYLPAPVEKLGLVAKGNEAHEKGVAHMAFCLHHSLALSAGVFVNTVDTTPDVLVWKLDRDRGLLEQGNNARLRGHEGQVVGMVFAAEELELVTGGADGTFLVWQMPSLVLKQRFTRLNASPLADQALSCFSIVPRSADRPMLLVAGVRDTAGLEIFARMEKKVHEELIKAEFCPYLQRFVTVSARRATVWDGKTGEALTTLTSERLLGNDQADITAFSLDHQVRCSRPFMRNVNLVLYWCVFSVGGDGALHVLDDADPTGYVKSRPTADAKRKATKASSPRTWQRGTSGEVENDRNSDHRAGHPDDDNREAVQDVWRGERRRVEKRERSQSRSRPEDGGHAAPTAIRSGVAGTEVGVAAEGPTIPGQEIGVGKRGDGGRSVLLRQVVLSAHDGDTKTGADDSGGENTVKRLDVATRCDSELPPQQLRRTVHANDPHADSIDDQRFLEEPPENSAGSTASSDKLRFSKAARALMDSSFRQELLERELKLPGLGEDADDYAGDLLFAKPTFDMTACAADDHLSIIATAATSDGGIETPKPTRSNDGTPATGSTASTRVGRASSSLHLWDAETMGLLGTLLLPCLALTRDLANAAAAFSIQSPRGGTSPPSVNSAESPCPPLEEANDGHCRATSIGNHSHVSTSAGSGTTPGADSSSPTQKVPGNVTPAVQQQQQPPFAAGAVKAGTGRSRPDLVTALEIVSPYPLVMATSTEVTVVYAGNGSGDIIAAYLSRAELAELSGHANGPVPCQRRPNHNPYRAVRVELSQQAAHISFQAACRAQRKAATKGATGGARATKQRFPTSLSPAVEPAARNASPARDIRGGPAARSDGNSHGIACVGSSATRKRRPEAGQLKPSASLEDRVKGSAHVKKPSWMSGWDCMARQLKDFEETLEASSSARKKKVAAFHLGKPSSSAIAQPVRKAPLRGKRWRTKAAPWPSQDDKLLEKSASEQGLPTAGSTRLGAQKSMGGYVKPIAGSAEEAALKRSRSRGATGMVLKDTIVDQSKRDSFQGRPLDEYLAWSQGGRVLPATDPPGGDGGLEAALDKTIKGLPPMAVLAASHGGRLVASGITVAGDRGGGGFNVKAARTAARTALRQTALVQEIAIEEERKARAVRAGPRYPHLSLAPSFGGTPLSSGSIGSRGGASIVETEASSSVGPSLREAAGERAAEEAQKLRGLNENSSLVWASSMRRSSLSGSSSRNQRRRREDGAGQVETIQRLDAWGNFQGGVKSALNQWTALRLAVENNWGGGDSERKAALLEEGLMNLFKTKKEIYKDEVEDFLADFLDDSFSTYAEDDSPAQVAAMLVEMFAQCGRLDYTLANAVRAEEQRLLAKKAATPGSGMKPSSSPSVASSRAGKRPGAEDEDDSSSDEDDDMEEEEEEEEAGGGGAAGAAAVEAAVDADGWATVSGKKAAKGRRR
eukprot:g8628.t1